MQIQQLLAELLHGTTYQVNTDTGDIRQESRPPNSAMLLAARVIQELYQQNEQLQQTIQNQQYQIQKLLEPSNVSS